MLSARSADSWGGTGYENKFIDIWEGKSNILSRAKNYMKTYTVTNELNSEVNGTFSNVMLSNPSPETGNREKKYEQSQGFKVGGEVSYGDKGPSGKLTGGVEWSKKTSWTAKDVVCAYAPANLNLKPAWRYTFCNQPKMRGWPNSAKIKNVDKDDLSRAAMRFENFWVWRLDTNDRSKNPRIAVQASMTTGILSTIYKVLYVKSVEKTQNFVGNKQYVALAKPPLLALENHETAIDGKSGSTASVKFAVQGECTIAVNSAAADWCYAAKVDKVITIKAKSNNTTGNARKAQITIKRTGGTEQSDTQVLTVTQHPNL